MVRIYPEKPPLTYEDIFVPGLKQKWIKKHVEPTSDYSGGRFDARLAENHGKVFGHYHTFSGRRDGKPNRRAILCAGRIEIGLVWHDLGVLSKSCEVFLGRDGTIWRLQGVLLERAVPDPFRLTAVGKRIWADGVARAVQERLTQPQVLLLQDAAQTRYRQILRAHVKERALLAASLGRRRDAKDWALAVCRDWTEHDLLSPRHPEIRHALYFALALALDGDDAADLLHLAAWLEYGIPVFDRATCVNLYASAVRQLSLLVPAWHAQSYLCDWRAGGSITEAFQRQYARVLGEAVEREMTAEAVIGIDIPTPSSSVRTSVLTEKTAQASTVDEFTD